MNQRMVGADVAELRALAQQFDAGAAQLQQLAGSVRNKIQIASWVGPRASRFRVEWDSTHSAALRRVAVELRTSAGKLRAEADQQDKASNSLGPGASSGHPGGGSASAGEAAEHIKNLIEKLVEGGSNIQELMERKDLIERLSRTGLSKSTIDEILASRQGPAKFLSKVGTTLSWLNFGNAVATGDQAGTKTAALGIAVSKLPFPYNVAAGGAMIYGTAMLPTTDKEISSTVDHVLERQFGEGTRSDNLTMQQSDWLTKHYEGPMGVMNSISDGVDEKMRWLAEPSAQAGKAFGDWVRGWGK